VGGSRRPTLTRGPVLSARQRRSLPVCVVAGQNAFADAAQGAALPIEFCPMLVDIILACAPVVVVVPAVITLLTSHVSYTTTERLRKRLLESLTLAEKLPAATVGSAQIARDIDRQTLHLAYQMQYPHRGREIRDIALIGVGLVAALVAYYVLLWGDAALLYLLAFLALVVVAALWLERVVVNFTRNDGLVHELFTRFGAPLDLVRPHTELVLKAPTLTSETHYRNERQRLASHRSHLHGARDPLLRWSGNGASSMPPQPYARQPRQLSSGTRPLG